MMAHKNRYMKAGMSAWLMAQGFVIPIQKNNLTSLSRLAVLVVLSVARRLVSLLF
jgi:hypothetical protein